MAEFYAARRKVNGSGDSHDDKRFVPTGAIFFFALLIVFYGALWLVVYWLMIARA